MAGVVKSSCDQVGFRLPAEVGISGYDDDQTAKFLNITSVRQPVKDLAQSLFEILLGEINEQPAPNRQVVFEPQLVIRNSTLRD